MSEYKIKAAMGSYVIVEAVDKSTVLKTEETATVFRVISVGKEQSDKDILMPKVEELDLVIVAPNSIEKTTMGNQEVYYVRESDIIAVVED